MTSYEVGFEDGKAGISGALDVIKQSKDPQVLKDYQRGVRDGREERKSNS